MTCGFKPTGRAGGGTRRRLKRYWEKTMAKFNVARRRGCRRFGRPVEYDKLYVPPVEVGNSSTNTRALNNVGSIKIAGKKDLSGGKKVAEKKTTNY